MIIIAGFGSRSLLRLVGFSIQGGACGSMLFIVTSIVMAVPMHMIMAVLELVFVMLIVFFVNMFRVMFVVLLLVMLIVFFMNMFSVLFVVILVFVRRESVVVRAIHEFFSFDSDFRHNCLRLRIAHVSYA